MCTRPRNFDGQPVACRECNECVAARIGDWLARGVAESASAGYTLVVRLSYRNLPDGTPPAGARAFRYSDVRKWLNALRQSYFRHYGERGEIRFLAAGEIGSKGTQRVHYHVLLWSDRPLHMLGDWIDFATGKKVAPWKLRMRDLADKIKRFAGFEVPLKRNLDWSLWPHGHVCVQRPDAGGIAYVLKYAVKDQFNVVKSRGHSREAKAETFGAGLLRMSKQPPIGWRWLVQRMAEHEANGTVPVGLNLRVPGLRGYYYPKGKFREFVLERCHVIAQDRKERLGAFPAGWDTLLASVSSNLKDWEILTYGPDHETPPEERAAAFKRWFASFKHEIAKREGRYAAVLRSCTGGGCESCRNTLGTGGVAAATERDREAQSRYAKGRRGHKERYEALVPTHICHFRNDPDVRKAFRTARHVDRLNRAIRGRSVPGEGQSEV